jgi:hypothetical protein
MKIGNLEIRRRPVDDFTAATLTRAYVRVGEPDQSLVSLAVLYHCCDGPADWPKGLAGSHVNQGREFRGYLEAHRVSMADAIVAGDLLMQALQEQDVIIAERAEELKGFFGPAPTSLPAAV